MGLKKPDEVKKEDAPELEAEQQMDIEEAEAQTEAETSEAPQNETKTQSTEVAETRSSVPAQASRNFQQDMEEQGLSGLELGFGSFPILKIVNEGRFEDEDENDYGTSFVAVVNQTRIKHLYKQAGSTEGEVYYSYDGENLVKPSDEGASTVDALKAEFKEYGYDLEVKDYLEAVVLMKSCNSEDMGDIEDEMFILSIPPASRSKFSGVMATAQLKGLDVKATPIEFSVGKKRKARRSASSYFPWAFKIA